MQRLNLGNLLDSAIDAGTFQFVLVCGPTEYVMTRDEMLFLKNEIVRVVAIRPNVIAVYVTA